MASLAQSMLTPAAPPAAAGTCASLPVEHPSLDALLAEDGENRFSTAMKGWWQQHEEWRAAFHPSDLDDVGDHRPHAPPTLKSAMVYNPSPEQTAAYAEAAQAHADAHAKWKPLSKGRC